MTVKMHPDTPGYGATSAWLAQGQRQVGYTVALDPTPVYGLREDRSSDGGNE